VAVPDSVLLWPGRLSAEQMEIMRTHSIRGAAAIEWLIETAPGVPFLQMAADVARSHHERYDGAGYPDGLRGNAIPLAARIVAVADVYDALTTSRTYKQAYDHDKAMGIIIEGSGTCFDPDVVDAFVQLEREFAVLVADMADEPYDTPGHVDGLAPGGAQAPVVAGEQAQC
jgi:putative two-component system response regulator